MDSYTHIGSYERYELLRFNKWNRRLLNLYWIFNAIVLMTELTLLYYFYSADIMWFSFDYHLYYLIFIPTVLMLGFTVLCEIALIILKKKRKNLIPYAMTLTCVAYCSILLGVHYGLVVLSVTYIVPIIISLMYDNKNVLRVTSCCSFVALGTVCFIILNYADTAFIPTDRTLIDTTEIITAAALLITTYLLCNNLLTRNREIINTLVDLEVAKSSAQAEANARTRFLANMSHEIRTPMNGIIGLTELALDDSTLSPKQRDYLEKINRSAEGLIAIVNDILDIAKIDAGQFTVEKTPFYLHEVLLECKIGVMHSAEEKGIRFIVHDETSLAGKIIGDPTKLRQVLLNLLSNAVKFTKKGSVTLTVKGNKQAVNTTAVYFEIADTGIGMTPEQQATIFNPFRQADDSTTRKFGGTGLGLSITKSIIEMMGGEIRVESAPNAGSKFSFELTFEMCDEKSAYKIAIQETTSRRPVFAGSVLVCEDNELNRQVTTESLEKLGFSVTVAENGKLGIDEVNKRGNKPFDVIFMDIHMPVMDGFSAAKELIQMGSKTPIIAMTADAMPADRERCLQIGMADYISKPFKLRDVWLCLQKYLTPVGEVSNDESSEIRDYKEDAVIDRLIGIENSAGSEDLYKKMLMHFTKKKRDAYERLEKAIENKDYKLARHIAHDEKGSAQIIGAIRLTEILNDLDGAFKNGISQKYTGLMNVYSNELDNVLEYIKSLKSDT